MSRSLVIALLVTASIALAGCAADNSVGRFKVGKSYSVNGQTYYPEEDYTKEQTGIASWYGPGFDGKKTANGERFDEDALTAAHPTLQMPSLVRVTNLENGRSLVVRVNDRGPFHSNRVMDVSRGAARQLDMIRAGTAHVRLQVLGPESQALAEAAKRGIDTKGSEIAVNQTGTLDERFASFYPGFMNTPRQPNVMVAAQTYQPPASAGASLAVQNLGVPPVQPPFIRETIVMNDPAPSPRKPAPSHAGSPIVSQPVLEVTPIREARLVPPSDSDGNTHVYQMAPVLDGEPQLARIEELPVAGNYLPEKPGFKGVRP